MIELFAVTIPLEMFDQQKLEALVRKIPVALVRAEKLPRSERKFYLFPKMDDKGLKIACEAEHFSGSPIPSRTSCHLQMLFEPDSRTDEQKIEFRDPFVVNRFFEAISYGDEWEKRWFSTERVFGRSLNGRSEKHFRFSLRCTRELCRVTFSTAPGQNL